MKVIFKKFDFYKTGGMHLKHFKTFFLITMAILVIGTGCANKKKKKTNTTNRQSFGIKGF